MTKLSHILVVDDDRDITELLAGYLSRFSLQCHTAANGVEMRAQLARHPVELVVMDLMLPGEDGLTLAREIRLQSALPVIMLTARAETFDRVVGLESGADDYVSKPFEPRELVARIQTVLRRTRQYGVASSDPQYSDVVNFDGWELHRHDRSLVSPAGVVVALSNAEFRLLSVFLRAPKRLLTRDQLMEQARGRNMDAFERSIDLLVSRLRQKLGHEPQGEPLIKTVRGAGYMLNAQAVHGRMAWPQRA
ncbi:response regulator transcription factor [Curvibacter sp. APW13]|uniref:response regulator transcription factor n=1 Tax=Curvibacter sp. APW13 TaxID=3077236 RepID=UPI0028DD9308|nr:response regulator transcription factor [Curvibacter sp. APW13]MDT8992350.1 response regulator transcription factor [Curvibacter sp. APW13]